jgi:protein phosphatase
VQTFLEGFPQKPPDEPIAAALKRWLDQANTAILARAEQDHEVDNVGTTLAAVVIHHQHLHWIAVGDSRLYLYRAGQVMPLTEDHTYGRELDRQVAAGRIQAIDAATHPGREALTSFLGLAQLDAMECNLQPVPLQAGDRILLCSDGLYRGLSATEIAEYLAQPHPQRAAEALLGRVLAQQIPHQDNVTVAILALNHTEPARRARNRWQVRGLAALLIVSMGVATLGGWAWRYTASPVPATASSPATPVRPPSDAEPPTAAPEPATSAIEPPPPAPASPLPTPPAPAPVAPTPPPPPSDQGIRT